MDWSDWTVLVAWALGVKATILVLATATVIRVFNPGIAWQTLLWRITLLWVALLMPAELLLPTWQLAPHALDGIQPVLAADASGGAPAATAAQIPTRNWLTALPAAALFLYAAGVALRLALLILGAARLGAYRAQSRPIDEPSTKALVVRLCRRIQLRKPPLAFWSRQVTSPISWGFRRPAMLLPEHWKSADDRRLEHGLAHELAHIRRGDWLWHIAAAIVDALGWWNPVIRWAVRRHSEQVEVGCDQLAISCCGSSRDYAKSLLLAAKHSRTATLMCPALGMARTSELARRIEMLARQPQPRGPKMTLTNQSITHFAASLILLPLAACSLTQAAPLPAQSSAPTPAVSPAPGPARPAPDRLMPSAPPAATAPSQALMPTPSPALTTRPAQVHPTTAPSPASAPVVAQRARGDAALARAEAMRAEARQRLARQHSAMETERAQLAGDQARVLAAEAAEMAEMRAALAQVSDRQRVMSDEMAQELAILRDELERTRQQLEIAHEELARLRSQ